MTNEELASEIKAGDDSLQEELWLQIKDFIAWLAKKYYYKYSNACTALGLELEDFIQVGYFAMLGAVKTFAEDGGAKFTTHLHYYLTNQFSILLERHQQIASKETMAAKMRIKYATSLDAQLKDEDRSKTNSYTFLDTYPDPLAEQAFEEVENSDYLEQLRSDLSLALRILPKQQALCIRQYYLENSTQAYIAKTLNKSASYVQGLIRAGLLSLRRCSALSEYRQSQVERAYAGGMGGWKATGSSIQERIVMNIDEQEQRLKAFLQDMEDFCSYPNT